MMGYLQPEFTQNLPQRAAEIADALGSYLDANLAEAMARVDHAYEAFLDYLNLYRLRERFGIRFRPASSTESRMRVRSFPPHTRRHAAFLANGDPMKLFHHPGSHYNAAGYSTVARAVERALAPPRP